MLKMISKDSRSSESNSNHYTCLIIQIIIYTNFTCMNFFYANFQYGVLEIFVKRKDLEGYLTFDEFKMI